MLARTTIAAMARREVSGLGGRIALARKAAGLSQARLAAAIEVDPSQIFRIEKGRHDPSSTTLFNVARATGVSADWLLDGRAPHGTPGPEWDAFVAANPEATEDELVALNALARTTPTWVNRRVVFWESVLALMRGHMRPEDLRKMAELNQDLDRKPSH